MSETLRADSATFVVPARELRPRRRYLTDWLQQGPILQHSILAVRPDRVPKCSLFLPFSFDPLTPQMRMTAFLSGLLWFLKIVHGPLRSPFPL